MTQERYFEMQEQMGIEPDWEKMPVDFSEFPHIVPYALEIFGRLGDRVYPEIGYIGKDYTKLNLYMEVYGIEDKDLLLEILEHLDARAIKQSSEQLKREYDKIKRKTSGSQRNSI
tara:strand:- start:1152 stop:1496 length:345 start_codon:yes stop_codon:yes gene_type:complete